MGCTGKTRSIDALPLNLQDQNNLLLMAWSQIPQDVVACMSRQTRAVLVSKGETFSISGGHKCYGWSAYVPVVNSSYLKVELHPKQGKVLLVVNYPASRTHFRCNSVIWAKVCTHSAFWTGGPFTGFHYLRCRHPIEELAQVRTLVR